MQGGPIEVVERPPAEVAEGVPGQGDRGFLFTRCRMFNPDLKRGSLELLILSVLEAGPRHGYEIGKRLERLSQGRLEFKASTLYSILYRMEDRKWVKGRWVERKGERRRCYYTLTARGQGVLEAQREEWKAFAAMVNRVIGLAPKGA
jgi:transcriptional regulator